MNEMMKRVMTTMCFVAAALCGCDDGAGSGDPHLTLHTLILILSNSAHISDRRTSCYRLGY